MPTNTDWMPEDDDIAPFQSLGMTDEIYDLLSELARDDDYWSTASSFVESAKSEEYSSLSDRQQDWLCNIIATLRVRLDRQAARELFRE